MRFENIRSSMVPLTGTPPSNDGGSHVMKAESSPTDVHLTFSGALGTSGDTGYSWREIVDKAGRRLHEDELYARRACGLDLKSHR